MTEERANEKHRGLARRVRWVAKVSWLILERSFDLAADVFEDYVRVIRLELELFFGAALAIIGLLNFQNGKNCDGNTADYLACTHPSTYYYYNAFDVALVVFGVFLILIWLMKRKDRGA